MDVTHGPDRIGTNRLARHHHESRGVRMVVLGPHVQRLEPVDLAGEAGRDRRDSRVAALRDVPCRARGVGGRHRLRAELADEATALRVGLDMALDVPDAVERRARHREELVLHRLEVLGHDVQVRLRQQVVDVRDPAPEGVLDRDHHADRPRRSCRRRRRPRSSGRAPAPSRGTPPGTRGGCTLPARPGTRFVLVSVIAVDTSLGRRSVSDARWGDPRGTRWRCVVRLRGHATA